jgi:cell division protein ZipA
MQELRLVLIIVGALAIAALLFHGLWKSKKEGKSKFAEKSVIDSDERESTLSSDDFDIVKKEKGDSAFGVDRQFSHDPLGVDDPLEQQEAVSELRKTPVINEDDLPQISLYDDLDNAIEDKVIFSEGEDEIILKPKRTSSKETVKPSFAAPLEEEPQAEQPQPAELTSPNEATIEEIEEGDSTASIGSVEEVDEPSEEEMSVIVINVHCAGDEPFVGTKLFDSMQQNGLIYGEMDIFHRHSDLSGTGKVLFSVANMMQPGTLKHDDPATFTTKGISFFMTLPCYGEADQNFKVMLRTAQQIADDLGANVLDEQRNLMTPDKLLSFHNQIRAFKSRSTRTND